MDRSYRGVTLTAPHTTAPRPNEVADESRSFIARHFSIKMLNERGLLERERVHRQSSISMTIDMQAHGLTDDGALNLVKQIKKIIKVETEDVRD